jgi:hypothetical protein
MKKLILFEKKYKDYLSSILFTISLALNTIFEKANRFFPKSFREAQI